MQLLETMLQMLSQFVSLCVRYESSSICRGEGQFFISNTTKGGNIDFRNSRQFTAKITLALRVLGIAEMQSNAQIPSFVIEETLMNLANGKCDTKRMENETEHYHARSIPVLSRWICSDWRVQYTKKRIFIITLNRTLENDHLQC